MRSRWRVTTTATVMVTGLFAFAGAAPALAQPVKAKAAVKVVVKAPRPLPPPKPLTEKQKKDAARKAYKEAEVKYKENDFQHALELYKTADDLVPVPVTKYKIAVCEDKLGHVTAAVAGYQAFLDASPDPAKLGDAIADARTQIDKLKKTPGKFLIAIAPPDAPRLAVSVDGNPAQPAASLPVEMVSLPGQPPTRFFALVLPPGHHRIAISAGGYDPAATDLDLPFADDEGRARRPAPDAAASACAPADRRGAASASAPAPAAALQRAGVRHPGPRGRRRDRRHGVRRDGAQGQEHLQRRRRGDDRQRRQDGP